jgi:hypothetical protein
MQLGNRSAEATPQGLVAVVFEQYQEQLKRNKIDAKSVAKGTALISQGVEPRKGQSSLLYGNVWPDVPMQQRPRRRPSSEVRSCNRSAFDFSGSEYSCGVNTILS